MPTGLVGVCGEEDMMDLGRWLIKSSSSNRTVALERWVEGVDKGVEGTDDLDDMDPVLLPGTEHQES